MGATSTRTTSPIPGPAGLPWVGNVVPIARDPYRALVRWQQQFGDVFRLRLMGQDVVALLGIEANRLMRQRDGSLFVAGPAMAKLAWALGTKRFLMTMDGEEHRELRRILMGSMSRSRLAEYVPIFAGLAADHFQRWGDEPVPAAKLLKRLVYEQLAHTLSSRGGEAYYDDVLRVFDASVKVGVARMWPSAMMSWPPIARSRRRLQGFCETLMEDAEASRGAGGFNDCVRVAVEAGLLNRDDLFASLMGPYFAGIDTTASTLASAMYHMAIEPRWTERMRDEVAGVGGLEQLTARKLRDLRFVRAFVKETLRRYPIGILGTRSVAEDFAFAGKRIPAGTLVSLSPPIVHFYDEYWPDPWTFDPDRFLAAYAAKIAPELYAPYSLGSRVCLGAGLADVQMIVTIAVLATHYELALGRPDYRIRIVPDPLPVARGLTVRLSPGR